MGKAYWCWSQPSPHFSYSEINALPLNGQQAVTAISALWLRRSTAFRWLQQPIGRHLMIDVVEQVIERHQEVKNEGISERQLRWPNGVVCLHCSSTGATAMTIARGADSDTCARPANLASMT